MVSSPMYDRLMEFANSAPDNEKLYGWDDEHSAIVKAIREARDKVKHFKEYQGFTGQAGQAMSDEAARAIRRFDSQANFYMTGMSYYVEARRAIMLAAEDARQLSPTLLDPMTESLRHAGEVTIPIASKFGLPGKFVNSLVADGLAYVEGVEAQANAQREAKATEIIERFESTMNDLNTRLQSHSEAGVDTSGTADTSWTPIPELPADTADALRKGHIVISPHEGGAYGRSRSDAFGNAGLRGTDSGLYPAGYDEGETSTSASCAPRVSPTGTCPRATSDRGRIRSRTRRISWTWTCCTPESTVIGTRTGSSEGTPPLPRSIAIIPSGGSIRRAQRRLSLPDASAARGCSGLGPWACAGRRAWVDLRWVVSGARVSLEPASPVGWGRLRVPRRCAPDRSAALAWAPTHPRAARLERVRQRAARLLPRDSRAASWAVPARELAAGRRTRRSVVAAGMRPSASRMRRTRACRADTSIPSRRPMARIVR